MSSSSFASRAEAKKEGWHSRRHPTPLEHQGAVARYRARQEAKLQAAHRRAGLDNPAGGTGLPTAA